MAAFRIALRSLSRRKVRTALIGSLVTIGVVAMAAGGVRKVLAAEVDASLPDGSPPRRAGAEGAATSGRSDPS